MKRFDQSFTAVVVIAGAFFCFGRCAEVQKPGLDAGFYTKRGVEFQLNGQCEEAISDFSTAIEKDRLIEREAVDSIDFTTRVTIEVHTASFRSVRGYTIAMLVADELAFWRTDDSANPDSEIIEDRAPGHGDHPRRVDRGYQFTLCPARRAVGSVPRPLRPGR